MNKMKVIFSVSYTIDGVADDLEAVEEAFNILQDDLSGESIRSIFGSTVENVEDSVGMILPDQAMEDELIEWTKKLGIKHWAIAGFHDKTLCGMPMLGDNYAKYIKDEDKEECKKCKETMQEMLLIKKKAITAEQAYILSQGLEMRE